MRPPITAPGSTAMARYRRSSRRRWLDRPSGSIVAGGRSRSRGVRPATRAASRSARKMTTASTSVPARTCQSPTVTIGSNVSSMTGRTGSVGTRGVYRRGRRRSGIAGANALRGEGGDELPHRVHGPVERDPLVGRQLDLEHPLEPAAAEHDGYPDEQPVDAELALQERGAGQHALSIAQDRVDHLERGRGRRIERGAGLEQADDLGTAVRRALLERADPFGGKQLRDRHAGNG